MKIKALGYLVIETKKPEQWATFLTDIVGLMPASSISHPQINYFKMDNYLWRIAIIPGQKEKVSIAGWEVSTKQDFDDAIEELRTAGTQFIALDEEQLKERGVKEAIRFTDPAGGQIEIFYQMPLDYIPLQSNVGITAFETGFNGDMGLGHYVIPTNNFDDTYNFYREVLGFGQTDYMEFKFAPEAPMQGLNFLHVDNPRHHSLAIFDDPTPPEHGCVHLMFEVFNMDDVGYFIDRCKSNDIKISSTLGKHTNDLMTSVYVESPGGFAIEFGTGGLQLDWHGYKPTVSARPSLWGHSWGG
ncbi:MAG: VOC family protein [Sinobacterium sp.]|nr:VOC family protein [Sinobacterium sp.]